MEEAKREGKVRAGWEARMVLEAAATEKGDPVPRQKSAPGPGCFFYVGMGVGDVEKVYITGG